jgi:hypothetical protein
MLASPRPEAPAVTPTQTALDPAVFPPEVLAFAAERGVTDCLQPLLDLTRECFPGIEISMKQENDYEIPGLGWIVFEVPVYATWADEPRRAARYRWTEELVRRFPPAAREPFVLGMR